MPFIESIKVIITQAVPNERTFFSYLCILFHWTLYCSDVMRATIETHRLGKRLAYASTLQAIISYFEVVHWFIHTLIVFSNNIQLPNTYVTSSFLIVALLSPMNFSSIISMQIKGAPKTLT